MQAKRCLACQFSQRLVEVNICSSPSLPVIKHPAWNRAAKHLFQTKRLRAELSFIGRMYLGLAPFVFDWDD